jgi:non-specific serine/threonine protein kinase/serine/threonine-protein kinase
MAIRYFSIGRHDEGVRLQEEANRLRHGKLGPDHSDTLHGAYNLAVMYIRTGRLQDAVTLLEEALETSRRKLGAGHATTLAMTSYLARAYQILGRLDKGLPLYEEALRVRRATGRLDPPGMLFNLNMLALGYQDAGRHGDAIPLFEEAVEIRKKSSGPNTSADVKELLNRLAESCLETKQCARAESAARESLDGSEKGKTDETTAFVSTSLLGAALACQKKFAEAEPLLIRAYEGLKTGEPKAAQGRQLARAARRLVSLYEAWNKPDKATEWRAKLPPEPRPKSGQAGPMP